MKCLWTTGRRPSDVHATRLHLPYSRHIDCTFLRASRPPRPLPRKAQTLAIDDADFTRLINDAIGKAMRERGHVNVLIAGRSGAGKSTLINAVFQDELAETGQGRPVTQNTREITKAGAPISIWDTRGLEMEDFAASSEKLIDLIRERQRERDPNRQIHVAWLCVQEGGRRVESAEIALHLRLAEMMPVLAVITKAQNDAGFRAEVQSILTHAKNVVRVRALGETLDEGQVLLPMGLDKLVLATAELVPAGQERAFAAAQRASIAYKKTVARRVLAGFAATAAGIGATPIPFPDATLLVPNQIAMLAGISAAFGLDVTNAFLATLVASAAGAGGATMLGRALVVNILKLIPGPGTVAGAAIGAATASALTIALGELYVKVLAETFERNGGMTPSIDEVATAFERRIPTP